tara:strand:+ start:1636 stop:1809 length:174 start_codon:yes stop_codon:yes gene_type:complete
MDTKQSPKSLKNRINNLCHFAFCICAEVKPDVNPIANPADSPMIAIQVIDKTRTAII